MPAQTADRREGGLPGVAENTGENRKRLIADDHEMPRRGVRNMLQTQSDLEICAEATDGKDGIDKAKALLPDLVILDINMPALNGRRRFGRLYGAARN
jgi:DNA-binding NarL/FixJ family response regulator